MKRKHKIKPRKYNWQILVIVMASALASFSVFAYTASVTNNARQDQELVSVFMAQRQVAVGTSFGEAIDDGSITVKELPSGLRPLGSIATLNGTNAKLVAKGTIQAGQIVTTSLFAKTAANTGALVIPEGMLAVTVAMSDPAKVANFLQPGSEIVVFASGSLQSNSIESTQVLLPRITVLAIGDQVSVDDQPSNIPSLVTVAVTPTQAKKIIYASENLTLYFALRTDGVNVSGASEISNKNLFSERN